MSKQLSAKDLAFEKERAKYRKQIKELESALREEKVQYIRNLQDKEAKIAELESKIETQDDWIQRLLQYTEISEDDLQKIIRAECVKADATLYMKHMKDIFSNVISQMPPEFR